MAAREGDVFGFVQEEGDWVKVSDLTTGATGFVPTTYIEHL